MGSIAADLSKTIRLATSSGWDVRRTGGDHLVWTSPNKKEIIYTASTPNSVGFKKDMAKLKRAGLPLSTNGKHYHISKPIGTHLRCMTCRWERPIFTNWEAHSARCMKTEKGAQSKFHKWGIVRPESLEKKPKIQKPQPQEISSMSVSTASEIKARKLIRQYRKLPKDQIPKAKEIQRECVVQIDPAFGNLTGQDFYNTYVRPIATQIAGKKMKLCTNCGDEYIAGTGFAAHQRKCLGPKKVAPKPPVKTDGVMKEEAVVKDMAEVEAAVMAEVVAFVPTGSAVRDLLLLFLEEVDKIDQTGLAGSIAFAKILEATSDMFFDVFHSKKRS